ncbi:5-carboxymethyl-2-hydroxymuconate Delta-isomerase [Acinetobacter faecalis]|uniref:5-carboxymethyl-2-hydroxymuconate Delta-isomerase n=1 Tax=Acinetobacter faecalis TaxID=2665161 RepID=UPI002A91F2C7|nr:5-carboxymethyl-2-hydroxymuconate Delta-isomerase [Acinetobacter faecalis]MDY6480900.1 5-carboxymethyl-2-hydroxymuconate Delta-isomerase [Acinetobacter faecalis]
MPHIHLEYSDNIENLEVKPLLISLNQALIQGGYAQAGLDIKSRAICQTDYVIGDNEQNQAYMHLKLSLLTGRSAELRKEIAEKLLEVLCEKAPKQSNVTVQFCVEVLEMQRDIYAKKIVSSN